MKRKLLLITGIFLLLNISIFAQKDTNIYVLVNAKDSLIKQNKHHLKLYYFDLIEASKKARYKNIEGIKVPLQCYQDSCYYFSLIGKVKYIDSLQVAKIPKIYNRLTVRTFIGKKEYIYFIIPESKNKYRIRKSVFEPCE